ncbi:uncharacterized protein EV420DRAFT_780242 [Desarmillaria tabescens]|uniref:DUF6535 domain-containing protein n=1 Tax=Armillaria tabescens TaxID=1929756 RepID=A0AA39JY64_ARMTA|nr:uncharacterized protein EV420DRAFT_780242 [Desarmillaria tabescens]KAK0449634.1 hypothetical protein EV420DRAFT_780242 [Desarmillaria tabescens]
MPSIHSAQSDHSIHTVPSYPPSPNVQSDEDEKYRSISSGSDISEDSEPDAENIKSFSARRRRRRGKRKTMGIPQSGYQFDGVSFIVIPASYSFDNEENGRQEGESKGSDPFDYQHKFPDDKQHEELGSTAKIWRTYLEECSAFDLGMVEGWRDALDVLLVFAGLFSAVVSTFLVQATQSLQIDYSAVTASLLIELINVQRAAANGSVVNNVPSTDLASRPSASGSWVNGLWFTSLALSLGTALFAVLTKQWIHQYLLVPSGTPRDKCRVRHFRYMGLRQWRVDFIIGLLPVLMSSSLALFLVGLVIFIVPLHVTISCVIGALTFISFAAYGVTNFLPILYLECPYKTPLSHYMFPFYSHIYNIRDSFRKWVAAPLASTRHSESGSASPPPPPRTLRKAERSTVKLNSEETDVHAMSWLFHMTSNPSVWSVVVESVGALPLTSVKTLRQEIDQISFICYEALQGLLSQDDDDVQERRIDRLIRALLRFPEWSSRLSIPASIKERFSPSTYVELLSLQTGCHDEVKDLVQFNLTSNDKLLDLQPIVWAYLLKQLMPFDAADFDVARLLLLHLPEHAWASGFTFPPITFEWNGVEVWDNMPRDGVTLTGAIEQFLYPSIANAIFLRSAQIEDAVSNDDPNPEAGPEPQLDPRIRFLLNTVRWPEIRRIVVADDNDDTALEWVVEKISIFFAIDAESFDLNSDTPTSDLDRNRYAILKALYPLISLPSSSTFRDQRNLLAVFLRLLKSTSCSPDFLGENWCTPELASRLVQIAFEGEAWIWPYELRLDDPACELVNYFFRSIIFMDHTFAHFVDKQLFTTLNWSGRPEIMESIVVGLASARRRLPQQVYEQYLDILHEPQNLFTSCAALIVRGQRKTLRQLALFRRRDPAWAACLKRLREYYDDRPPPIFTEFEAFVTGSCVGEFGLNGRFRDERMSFSSDRDSSNNPC